MIISGEKMNNSIVRILNFFIELLSSKRDSIKNKVLNPNEFFDLCAIDNSEDKKCGELLKWGLENYKVKNIAVTGPYGAGKTSFLKSFENSHKEYKYLNISLASFKDDEDNDKKIEENILQQILYKVNGIKMPFSRIKRIREINKKSFIITFLSLYFWIDMIYYLFKFKQLKIFEELFLLNYLKPDERLIYPIMIFISTIILYKSLALFKSFKIKIKALSSEIELSTNDDASVFYTHLDEIIYFFKKTNYEVIFFEDIDRFEKINLDLFTKLRELNGLLNKSEDIKRTIHFIYAVKDDLFEENFDNENKKEEINSSDKLRTKFFDLIIPIIPVINTSNSYEQIIKKLKKVEGLEISDEFDSDLRTYSYYIDDMRLINNIHNEFIVYRDNLIKENKIKKENQQNFSRTLFAFMVYKNKYPNDFSKLHFDKGVVSKIFQVKNRIIENKIIEKRKEIKKYEELITSAKKENFQTLKELRTIFSLALYKEKSNALSFENYSIDQLINNEDNFNELIKKTNIQYQYSDYYGSQANGNLFLFSKLESNLSINYEERKRNIENKNSEKQEEMKGKIKELNSEINELRVLTLSEIIFKYGVNDNLFSAINKDNLLRFFLESSLIEEKTYKNYISYFYAERFTREDFDFVESVKRETPLPHSHKLFKIKEVIKDLNVNDFKKRQILNYDLLDEILKKYYAYPNYYKNIITTINENVEELIDFLYEYQGISKIKKMSQKILVKEIPGYWQLLIEKSNYTEDKIINIVLSIFRYSDLQDLKKHNFNFRVSDFFNERENSVEILEKMAEIDVNKTKEFIEMMDIKLKFFNPKEKTDLFDYLYENSRYEISIKNINKIGEVLFENSDEVLHELEKKNYSTLMKVKEFDFLYEYICTYFNYYIKNIVLDLELNTKENQNAIIDILNTSEGILEIELKKEVIRKEENVFDDIELIKEKELWKIVAEENKMLANWDNVLNYFEYCNERLDENLLKLLNDIEFSKKLSEVKIWINKESKKELRQKISRAIIKNENISIEAFECLINSLYFYNHIELDEISSEKIINMLENNRFLMKKSMIEEFKKNSPDRLQDFIERKMSEFINVLNETYEILDESDYSKLISSNEITLENKLELLENLNFVEIEPNEDLLKEIKEYISKMNILQNLNESLYIKLNQNHLLPINNFVFEKLRKIDEENEKTEVAKYIDVNSNLILKRILEIELSENEYLKLFESLENIKDKEYFINNFDMTKLEEEQQLLLDIANYISNLEEEVIRIEKLRLAEIIITLKSDSQRLIFLNSQVENLEISQIREVLKEFDEEYSQLTMKKQIYLKKTTLNTKFLKKLEARDALTLRHAEKKEGFYRIYLKKILYKDI